MGRIGKHLKAEIAEYIEQVIETRLNYKQTALTFAPSGDDSPPIENDRIVLVSVDGNGKFAAVGVLTASQGAKAGEKILYSRNSDGEVQAIISLLNDGKIKLESPDEISIEAEKGIKTECGAKMVLSSKQIELTGGTLKVKGSVSPTGSGPFCALPVCAFTGAPQCGTDVVGT